MTTAAIWDQVKASGGEANSADPLAEVDATLNYLRVNAYPFERVGKSRWKWAVGHSAADRRWAP